MIYVFIQAGSDLAKGAIFLSRKLEVSSVRQLQAGMIGWQVLFGL